MWSRLHYNEARFLLVGGGVSYTVGVIWFIKDGRSCGVPDHTIWHLWVLGGSMMHFYCVLWYLVPFPFDGNGPWLDGLDAAAAARLAS